MESVSLRIVSHSTAASLRLGWVTGHALNRVNIAVLEFRAKLRVSAEKKTNSCALAKPKQENLLGLHSINPLTAKLITWPITPCGVGELLVKTEI